MNNLQIADFENQYFKRSKVGRREKLKKAKRLILQEGQRGRGKGRDRKRDKRRREEKEQVRKGKWAKGG